MLDAHDVGAMRLTCKYAASVIDPPNIIKEENALVTIAHIICAAKCSPEQLAKLARSHPNVFYESPEFVALQRDDLILKYPVYNNNNSVSRVNVLIRITDETELMQLIVKYNHVININKYMVNTIINTILKYYHNYKNPTKLVHTLCQYISICKMRISTNVISSFVIELMDSYGIIILNKPCNLLYNRT
jgi:hypothetical protein